MSNIIFIHGISSFKLLFPKGYYKHITDKVTEQLGARGVRVLLTTSNDAASLKSRAAQLRQQIDEAWASGALDPQAKTHLIAHSMGGLDARLLMSPANPDGIGDHIATLTTVGSPHKGTPLADVAFDKDAQSLIQRALAKVTTGAVDLIASVGLDFKGLEEITTKGVATFNQTYPNHPNAAYYSVVGEGHTGDRPTSVPLFVPYQITRAATGEGGDGFINVSSAVWGSAKPMRWAADHGDLVDFDIDHMRFGSPNLDITKKYIGWVEQLITRENV